jgi:hypothetical protein
MRAFTAYPIAGCDFKALWDTDRTPIGHFALDHEALPPYHLPHLTLSRTTFPRAAIVAVTQQR